MQFLRRISTRQLLGLCAAVVALGLGVAGLALATTDGGPKPPPKPLAEAVHDALVAPQVAGVSGRVDFTNHLISSDTFEGSNPLISGGSGRFWAAPDGRLRIELQSSASGRGPGGDVQILVDRGHFTVFDSANNTAYEGTVPRHRGKREHAKKQPPTVERIQKAIDRAAKRLLLSGAEPSNVAGQPAYTVHVSPKRGGGLLGGVELAWDAAHGTPLRAAVFAKGNDSPVLELKVTDITFGTVPSDVFAVNPPAGTKITKVGQSERGRAGAHRRPRGGRDVTGLDAVQQRVSFKIAAPQTLAGMPQSEVHLIAHGKRMGALVTYGRGLGGIAVAQVPVDPKRPPEQPKGDDEQGFKLPSVSINGTTGQELDTALGTVIRFRRGGVQYVVAGSVPPAVALAAARGL